MNNPRISIIAAMSKDSRIIGDGPKIPWHIPEDFKYFKETTMDHPIIMGRKTFETFPKLLPGRTHIVITRDEDYEVPENVIKASSIQEAISSASELDPEEIFIIGGGQIYELGLELADRLYLTIVDTKVEGDIIFPEYTEFKKEISRRESEDENYKYSFVVLER
jgi:dihydrofolate reductase